MSSDVSATAPVGAIVMWGGPATQVAGGWLLCDGSEYLTKTYEDLFSAIHYLYGGSNDKFCVPDLRGYFIRGADWSPQRGFAHRDPEYGNRPTKLDNDRVGSAQGHELYHHSHGYDHWAHQNCQTGMTPVSGGQQYWYKGGAVSETGGAETRPINICLHYIIKATWS